MRLKRQREEADQEAEESGTDDEFLAEDDAAADWRQELKAITGYDPSK